jgi:hypothetical protein
MGITAIGLGATALSATIGAVGAIQSSSAQSSAARYQAQVATNNATIANQNATVATDQAGMKEQQDERNTAIKLGAQRAAMGAGGGTLDGGSNEAVQAATTQSGAMDVQNAQYAGDLQAYGLRTQSSNFTAQAGLDQMQAGNDNTAGLIGAGNSIVGGASQFASKWNSYFPSNSTTPTSTSWGNATQSLG